MLVGMKTKPKIGRFARLIRDYDPVALGAAIVVDRTNVRRWQKAESLPHARVLAPLSVATFIPLEDLKAAYNHDRTKLGKPPVA